MIIVPDNMTLKTVSDDDHAFLVDLHNDPVVLRNITNPTLVTFEQHVSWWNSIKNNDKELRLIFCIDDVNVGFTKFYNIDRCNRNCVLGADIHQAFRGKGYAKFMWTLMLKKCFDDMKLHKTSLSTAIFNSIGIRIYLGLGFKIEGHITDALLREDRYYDGISMYLTEDMFYSEKI